MTGFRFLLYERYMKTFSIILGMVVFGIQYSKRNDIFKSK